MLGLLWLFDEAWLNLIERIGGTPFMVICLLLSVICTVVWHAAFFYFKFGTLERGLTEVRQQMVTRDSFALALSEMERRLNNWANERFLTRDEAAPRCDVCDAPPRRRSSDRG